MLVKILSKVGCDQASNSSWFVENPETDAAKKIRDCISKWHMFEAERLQAEALTQTERRNEAQEKLATKPTKKAENDLRVSTQKIEKMTKDLARHKSLLPSELKSP